MECHFLSGGAVSYQDKFSIVDNREFRTTTKSKSRVALEKQSINQQQGVWRADTTWKQTEIRALMKWPNRI